MTIHSAIGPGSPIPQMNIAGVDVASLAWDDAIALLKGVLLSRHFTKVAFLNAHNSNVAHADPRLRSALDGALVLPDGVGVDIAAKLLYGRPFAANLNGTDFVPALARAVEKPLRVGLLGAKRANVEAAAAGLARIAPQHAYLVVGDGYFDAGDEAALLARMAEMRLDLLLAALGTPRQEIFVAEKVGSEHAPVSISVGALFDFLAGAVPRAPEWVRRARLEWVFRLILEPGRLWRRYLLGNPRFLFHVMQQKLRLGRTRT